LHWGVYLKANLLIADHDPPNEHFQIIDIGNFLHQNVKSQMHRKDSTRFKIGFQNDKKLDANTLLDGRVAQLMCWAEENGFDETDVKAALRRRVEAESTNDGDGTMARPAVAETVGERKSPQETLGIQAPNEAKFEEQFWHHIGTINIKQPHYRKARQGNYHHIGRRWGRRQAWEEKRRI